MIGKKIQAMVAQRWGVTNYMKILKSLLLFATFLFIAIAIASCFGFVVSGLFVFVLSILKAIGLTSWTWFEIFMPFIVFSFGVVFTTIPMLFAMFCLA